MDLLSLILLCLALFLAWKLDRAETKLADTNAFLLVARNELEKTERDQRVRARFNAESA